MAEKAPAFQCYAKDFLTGTMTMTLAERGAYITLLCYQWDTGSIPDDARARQRVLGASRLETERVWPAIRAKLVRGEDGAWRNHRLEVERKQQEMWRHKSRLGGQKSAHLRTKGGSPLVGRVVDEWLPQSWQPNGNTSSSTATSSPEEDLATTVRKDRPIYDCACFVVFPWMEAEFQKRLELAGKQGFALYDWYEAVRADMEAHGQSLPSGDSFRYLLDRLYRDAELPQPSIAQRRAVLKSAPSVLAQLCAAVLSDEARWALKHVCQVTARDGHVRLSVPAKYVSALEVERRRLVSCVAPSTIEISDEGAGQQGEP